MFLKISRVTIWPQCVLSWHVVFCPSLAPINPPTTCQRKPRLLFSFFELNLYLFIYLVSPGFLAGMPQQREPITTVPRRPDHNTGNSVPYSLRIVFGFFNVPQLFL